MSNDAKLPFRSTPLWLDIEQIAKSGPKNGKFDIDMRINTAKGVFPALKIIELEEKCDYAAETGGSMFVTFYMGVGDYTYKLYPFRDLIEVTLRKIPQNEEMGQETNANASSVIYRGILDIQKNPRVTATRTASLDYQTLQTSKEMVTVTLELVDRNFEVLRNLTVPGNTYREVTPSKLIAGLMVGQSQKIHVSGAPAIQGFDMFEADNSESMGDIIVPTMKVANVPTFVQEKLSGVYNTGMGTFFARYNGIPSWFVYPLFNVKRFDTDVERVVFFVAPPNELSGLDRTYRKAGKVLYVAITGGSNYDDDSQIGDLNQGVGIRQADANGIFNKPVQMTPEGPLADRARLNREVANRERPDGLYYAPTSAPSINPFKNYSEVAQRQVSNANIVWENAQPDLIYPGMPCKYVFMNAGNYSEIKGTVLGKYARSTLIGAAATSSSYRTSCTLGLCLEYFDKTPDQPTQDTPGFF